jgi:hypothetical protein
LGPTLPNIETVAPVPLSLDTVVPVLGTANETIDAAHEMVPQHHTAGTIVIMEPVLESVTSPACSPSRKTNSADANGGGRLHSCYRSADVRLFITDKSSKR